MTHCRVCNCDIGYLGWPNHVRKHKKKVEKHIGHWPTWKEVLEYFQIVPRTDPDMKTTKPYQTLDDFFGKAP